MIVCWSLQVLNPEQRQALPHLQRVLLLNGYFWLISKTQSSQLANTNQVEIKPVQRRGGTLITHITRWASELSITRLAALVLCIPTASAGRSPVHQLIGGTPAWAQRLDWTPFVSSALRISPACPIICVQEATIVCSLVVERALDVQP